jgi:hypothetical protein
MATARWQLAGAGTEAAGLAFGGQNSSGELAATEEYNGTAWSTVDSMTTARYSLAGAGTQAAGLAFGGGAGPASAATEEYNT